MTNNNSKQLQLLWVIFKIKGKQEARKRSTGVAPEVNLRNPLHAGDKAGKRGIHPGFETQGRRHQKSKTGVSVAPQKGLASSKN